MKMILALVLAMCFASVSNAQCENGVCLLPKVAEVVQRAASAPVRLVSAVAAPMSMAGQDCIPVTVAAVEEYRAVARRTPVRTILRSPFGTRPLQRLFSRCR